MSITFHTENSPEVLNLNVANRNGYVILRELLDQRDPECYGELDPSAVLRSLATSEGRVSGMVIPVDDNRGERVVLTAEGVAVERVCRVIDCGLPREQIERYIERLRALAEAAAEVGEQILWD